jgi:tRNA (guanine37-N1)-methyltransferase
MRFDVLTLFPDLLSSYVSQSLLKTAIEKSLVTVKTWDIRGWATGKHRTVDDRPYGGGPGMVMLCEPIFAAVEAVQAADSYPGQLIMLTPGGQRLNQQLVHELAASPRLILLCGRYEGFDDRIREGLKPKLISIGDYVCNGGEVPAMVLIDTVIRLVPGVLGDEASAVEESHSVEGILEYPQFTRPRVFRGMGVPEILFSGHHAAIAAWRQEESQKRTRAMHPEQKQKSEEP